MTEEVDEFLAGLNYMDLIGLVEETNRPPGGLDSILQFARDTALDRYDSILEVGTSTGYTAIELANLYKCNIDAIDINGDSLSTAVQRADRMGVSDSINFNRADVTDLPYKDGTFDIVCIGNVTSYVNDKTAAVAECARVLKPGGFFVAIPMYYHREPDKELLASISDAIGMEIDQTSKTDWLNLFDSTGLRQHRITDFEFEFVSKADVEVYVETVLDRSDLSEFPSGQQDALAERYRSYLLLFRENLQHLRHSVMTYRKPAQFEPELFDSRPVK